MECILERGSGEQDSSTNRSSVRVRFDIEIATELGHTFTHAGNADAVTGRPEGLAIFGREHALAVVGNLENDGVYIFAERDVCLFAPGVALDVGKTFLGDAEEGGFDHLREAAIAWRKFKRDFDAAALTKAVDVFLEGGDQTKVVEQGRMEQIRKRADLTGHLLEKPTGFVESALGSVTEGLTGLANLGKAEIDRKNGLGHAVVEFAADAAALFVLELKEFGGKLVNGPLSVLHFGDVGKGGDNAEDGAIGAKLGNSIAIDPDDLVGVRAAPTHYHVADRKFGAQDGRRGQFFGGNRAAIYVHRSEAESHGLAVHGLFEGSAKHVQSGLIGKLNGGVRIVEDDADVKIADEGAETLFAFAQSIDGATLLSEVGKGGNHADKITFGIEARHGTAENPKRVLGVGVAKADVDSLHGGVGAQNTDYRPLVLRHLAAIFGERDDAEIRRYFTPDRKVLGKSEHALGSGIHVFETAIEAVQNDGGLKIVDQGAEALFAFAKGLSGAALVGEVRER